MDPREEENYANNQGVSKEIKVEITMTRVDIRIRSKEIGGAIMIEAGYMSLLEIVRLLQQVLKRCPWRT